MEVAMTRRRAAIGSAVFFLVAPAVVAGLVPWLLTGWEAAAASTWWLPLRVAGALLVLGGAGVLVPAFARFVVEGRGTPAPVSPPEQLVVGGFYRYVRNPMYLAVVAVIVGQALLLWRPVLLLYAALVWVVVAVFVRLYEEPGLRGRFGDEYAAYCRAVPAWRPRRTPWRP
jgi:protein-S-isoprenylcysteine O-methyltransferase Ste14